MMGKLTMESWDRMVSEGLEAEQVTERLSFPCRRCKYAYPSLVEAERCYEWHERGHLGYTPPVLAAYQRWTETQLALPRTVEGMEELYAAFKQGWMEEKQRDAHQRLNHKYFGLVMTTPPDVWLTRALEFDRAFRGTDQDGDS